MRNSLSKVLGLAVAGAGLMFLSASYAQAESNVLGLTCDGYAQLSADTATVDIMQRAGAFETNKPGKVLMIAAGRKFYMPSQQVDQETLAPISAYERMSAWNQAYGDAKWQCLHANSITIVVKK